MKPKEDKRIRGNRNTPSVPKKEKIKPQTATGRFFSKMGYTIWITVMIIGGIIAFLVSLLVL